MDTRAQLLIPLVLVGLGCPACRCEDAAKKRPAAHKQAWQGALGGGQAAKPTGPAALLLSVAQFEEQKDPSGKVKVKPGPAKLLILQRTGGKWTAELLEDPESRVFHKARCLADEKDRAGILTIGGTKALLKHWRRTDGAWRGRTLWSVTFGGKWDRLRDFELGDVDRDGKDELVVATHDQGVIAVLQPEQEAWPATEIHRSANTFVHEVEIADVDGDGHAEIFATPSRPNEAGVSQAGGVLALRFDPATKKYTTEWVAQYERRHAKEVLAADIDGDGRAAVYVALEAQLEGGEHGARVVQPLEIRRYTPGKDGWSDQQVARLEGGIQARVLLSADLDGDRKAELVVTTMKGGIWRLLPPASGTGAWRKELIDSRSTGFEHAATAADLDGDGRDELYVVADDQDRVSSYVWRDGRYQRETLHTLPAGDLTWNIVACKQKL